MTTNAHEAGKVSDERLAQIAKGFATWSKTNSAQPQIDADTASALNELITRRAESQTGAVRGGQIADVIREASLEGAAARWRSCTGCHETNEGAETGHYPYSDAFGCYLGGGCHECGGIGAVWEYWSKRDLDQGAAALEPTPIKETASPAVPAEVQGVTDEWIRDTATDVMLATEVDEAIHTLTFALSRTDYQRLAAENERLRAMLFPYADEAGISGMSWGDFYLIGNSKSISELWRIENRAAQLEQFRQVYDEDVARERTLREAAEGKLAEAVKVLAVYADPAGYFHGDGDPYEPGEDHPGLAAEVFLASLTTPPTEQGET